MILLYFSKLIARSCFQRRILGTARHGGVLFEGTANSTTWLPGSRPAQSLSVRHDPDFSVCADQAMKSRS
jgi:hypothetical protein